MKRNRAVIFVLAGLMVTTLTSCASCGQTATADISTIELDKKGKVTEITIEDFPETEYDAEDFESYVDEQVQDYLSLNEDAEIEVAEDRVEDDTAYLTIEYDSADTYADFNGVSCYAGTIAEAKAAGYGFSMNFVVADEGGGDDGLSAEPEDAIQTMVTGSVATAVSDMSVFIVQTAADVKVPGTVKYFYSDSGSIYLSGSDTLTQKYADDNGGVGSLVYVIYE